MRLLTYNIREGGLGRAALIADVIKSVNPDVVALQEAREPQVVQEIARLAGFEFWGSQRAHSTKGGAASQWSRTTDHLDPSLDPSVSVQKA